MGIFNTTGETKGERKIVEASHGQMEWCKLYIFDFPISIFARGFPKNLVNTLIVDVQLLYFYSL